MNGRRDLRLLFLAILIALSPAATSQAQAPVAKPAFPLKVSENSRYLVDAQGAPFFWLGDTAWELFHRLNRDEADHYLRDRAAKRFTVIQAVVLAEYGGLTEPNPNGHLPLKDNDPTKPNDEYFAHVDWIVNRAEELGLVIGMLPTWGDKWNKKWGQGPEIFTPDNAAVYGEFLGKRYRDKPIVWILGGDRPIEADAHSAIIRAMAAGIKKGDGGRGLMTYHPMGGQTSARWFHKDAWLNFNMLQSGHEVDRDNWQRIAADYARTPAKPCLDGEPGYEDHPNKFDPKNGWLTEKDVRKSLYWSLFAGGCGYTYGCHDIWQFLSDKRKPVTHARTPWREALQLPGAGQVQHARALLESRPYLSRVPDQSLITSEAGKGGDRVQATCGEDGSFAFIYLPAQKPVTVHLGKLSGAKLRGWWFDPRDGSALPAGEFANDGEREFAPPAGPDKEPRDWVLVIDDVAKKFPVPGKRPPHKEAR
jgi:hypothetical protein